LLFGESFSSNKIIIQNLEI